MVKMAMVGREVPAKQRTGESMWQFWPNRRGRAWASSRLLGTGLCGGLVGKRCRGAFETRVTEPSSQTGTLCW